MINVERITTILRNFYVKKIGRTGLNAENINHGYCFNWAFLAYRKHTEAVLCTVDTEECGHAFIKLKNKYYDSETQQGVKDWRQLRTLKKKKIGLFK